MFKSITFDNGTEFHGYQKLEEEYPITCYFATPYHSWERGTNENTNGLIRQYIPKGSCMKHITQKHCNRIAQILNNRPRKRHCYKTPAEVYYGKDSSLHLMFELKFFLIIPFIFMYIFFSKTTYHKKDTIKEILNAKMKSIKIILDFFKVRITM